MIHPVRERVTRLPDLWFRTIGRTRITFIIEYTRQGGAVWAHHIPAVFLIGFNEMQLALQKRILRHDQFRQPVPRR
jgi:hypothetical protein